MMWRFKNLKKECKDSVIAVIVKSQKRSPLQYAVAKMASSFSPHDMVRVKEKSLTCFNLLVEKVVKLKWISPSEADEAKTEYLKFIDIEWVLFKDLVSSWHLMQPMAMLTRSWEHSCMARKNMRAYVRFACLCLFCHMAKVQLRGGSVLMKICLWKIWSTSYLLVSELFMTTCFLKR